MSQKEKADGMNGARAINAKCLEKASLSLSGCAFLCIYHAGVIAALREHAPQILENRICGASAGAIFAAATVCNICISHVTSIFLDVVAEARSYTFGALDRDFDLMEIVRSKITKKLPENAHEICNGRLLISVTRLSDMSNVILSEFASKKEVVDAICCSCFIPVYGGFVYPTFRGEVYIDGGASNNQPIIDENTITVSPFSGESDICPTDVESASMFDFKFSGTSIRMNTNNLYRVAICLFPPSPEECAVMCRHGFQDAMKFLVNNGFAPSSICLSIETDAASELDAVAETNRSLANYSLYENRLKRRKSAVDIQKPKSMPNLKKMSDYNGKDEEISSTLFMHLFPKIMQRALDESLQKGGLLDYLSTFKAVRLVNMMTMPLTASVQIFKFCRCFTSWLTKRVSKKIVDDWLSERVKNIIDFLLEEVHVQQAKVTERLVRHWFVTEFEINAIGSRQTACEQLLDVELSPEAQEERMTLQKVEQLRRRQSCTSIASNVATASERSRGHWYTVQGNDALSEVIEQTANHEAALAFHYKQDNKKVRICEIFDVERADNAKKLRSVHFE